MWIIEKVKKKTKINFNVNFKYLTNDNKEEKNTTIIMDEKLRLQKNFTSFKINDIELDVKLNIKLDVKNVETKNNQKVYKNQRKNDFHDDFNNNYNNNIIFQTLP